MDQTNAGSAPEVIRVGQLEIHYLQDAGKGCEMGSFVLVVPPGSNVPPPHSHPGNEELIYVLEGTLRYTVDGVTRDLRAGESMGTPRGSVHGFSNPPSPGRWWSTRRTSGRATSARSPRSSALAARRTGRGWSTL